MTDQQEAQRSQEQGSEEQAQGTYVYGVVPAGTSLEALESDDLPKVALIESGDLAAIVGDAPAEDEAATRDAVLAHSQVLAAAVRDAPVVPMRFGSIFPSDEKVRDDLLIGRKDELKRLFEKVEGCVQETLKVYYREDAVLRAIIEENEELARLREASRQGSEEETYEARVRLGELVSKAIEQRRERDGAEIMDQLAPLVVAGSPQPPEKELMVVNAPLLIERSRLSEFDGTVEQIAEERRDLMQFRLLGPMPAYHFLDEQG